MSDPVANLREKLNLAYPPRHPDTTDSTNPLFAFSRADASLIVMGIEATNAALGLVPDAPLHDAARAALQLHKEHAALHAFKVDIFRVTRARYDTPAKVVIDAINSAHKNCNAMGSALQRAGTELGIESGRDMTQALVPEIMALKDKVEHLESSLNVAHAARRESQSQLEALKAHCVAIEAENQRYRGSALDAQRISAHRHTARTSQTATGAAADREHYLSNWADRAPEWATYLAQDEDGRVWAYRHRPVAGEHAWLPNTAAMAAHHGAAVFNECLHRPHGVRIRRWRQMLLALKRAPRRNGAYLWAADGTTQFLDEGAHWRFRQATALDGADAMAYSLRVKA